jgi:N-methylhydantoinase A/oxoprolinase/acetone carboxylase beta subunit
MHEREFGFMLHKRRVLIDNIRVRSYGKSSITESKRISQREVGEELKAITITKTYYDIRGSVELLETPVYDLKDMKAKD